MVLFFFGCASEPKLKVNLDLLRPYSDTARRELNISDPFIASYKKGSKNLLFVAVDHAGGINSATFKTLREVFKSYHPEYAILEGFDDRGQESSPYYLSYAKRCNQDHWEKCGESAYGAFLAQTYKVPFISGEPSDVVILNEIKKQGFSTEDLLGFYLTRMVPQLKKEFSSESEILKELFKKVFPQKLHSIGISHDSEFANYDIDRYKNWYKNQTGNQFRIKNVSNDDVSPRVDRIPLFMNRISHYVGIARDTELSHKIQASLEKHNRVIVVYGGGHFIKQQAILEDLLGEPLLNKLF